MRRRVIGIFVIIFTCSVMYGFIPYISNDLEPEVIDGRGEALGRTSILSSSGANYLFNNPAMLGYLSQPDFQISSRLRQAATEAKIIGSSTETYNYESDWQTKLTGLCFARPVELLKDQKLKTAAGIGYRTYYDFTLKENIKVTDAYSGYETDYTYTGG